MNKTQLKKETKISIIADMNSTDAFNDMVVSNNNVENLKKLFDEFDFYDVCKAVYCFNSYVLNRSHSEMCFCLNYALHISSKCGKKKIGNYESFTKFVNEIITFFPPNINDDLICDDNGEVRICFNEHYYRTILGNGYGHVYGLYQIIEYISKRYGFLEKVEDAFIFLDKEITNVYSKNNFKNRKLPYDELYIPTKEYYDIVFANYGSTKIPDSLTMYSSDKQKRIVDAAFVLFGDNYCPLYNTAIPIVVYESNLLMIDNLDKDKVAIQALADTLLNNYHPIDNVNNIIFNAGVVEELEGRKIFKKLVFPFVIFHHENIIFFKENASWSSEELKSFEAFVEEQIKAKQLKLVDFGAETPRVIGIPFIENFTVVNVQPEIDYENGNGLVASDKMQTWMLLEIVELIHYSSGLNEICEFLISQKEYYQDIKESFPHFITNIDEFIHWKKQNKHYYRGATKPLLLFADMTGSEYYVLEMFDVYSKWFPFDSYYQMFNNPFSWVVKSEEDNIYEITDKKYGGGYGGMVYKENNHIFFWSINADLFKNKTSESLNEVFSVREFISSYIVKFRKLFAEVGLNNQDTIALYLPFDYAGNVDAGSLLKHDRNIVYSEAMFHDGILNIRYTLDLDKFYTALLKATDNSAELDILLELFKCFEYLPLINYNQLKKEIQKYIKGPKETAFFSCEIDYYASNGTFELTCDDTIKATANQVLAKECLEANLVPGKYTKKVFNSLARSFQKTAIPSFEKTIAKFNKDKLMVSLCSYYSATLIKRLQNSLKQEKINEENLSKRAKKKMFDNLIREDNNLRNDIRCWQYLIDVNLSIEHTGSTEPKTEDIELLFSLACGLLNIQDASDIAYYELRDVTLEIDNDYFISPTYSTKEIEKDRIKRERVSNCRSYIPSLKTSFLDRINEINSFFKEDTGVSFNLLMKVLDYLKHEFFATFKEFEIAPNVFRINFKNLIADYLSWTGITDPIEIEKVDKAFNYLLIDESKIKEVNGEKEEFVPIWEREGRCHRFEVRPLYSIDDDVVFSPVTAKYLWREWMQGITQFYPPYEYGLTKTRKYLIDNWKHECELKMEKDVGDLCRKNGLKAETSIDLHSRFKEENFPEDLGDYDCIAIDEAKKIIYCLETKLLSFKGSIREYVNYQRSCFKGPKSYDARFHKRIDYLRHHKQKIIELIFKINDINVNDYEIRNYMITNKIFTCDIKEIKFEIISYSEFEDLLLVIS